MPRHVIFSQGHNWYFICGQCPAVMTAPTQPQVLVESEIHVATEHGVAPVRKPR